VPSYDPVINATVYNDHTSQLLTNQVTLGVPIYHLNTNLFNMSYTEAFPTGTSLAVQWNNNRQTRIARRTD